MSIALSIGLTVYSFSTNKEIEVKWLGLFWIVISISIPMILCLIFLHKEWAFITLAAVTLVAMGIHVVFDTHRMCGRGQGKHQLKQEEYVLFIVMLWADLPSIACDYVQHRDE